MKRALAFLVASVGILGAVLVWRAAPPSAGIAVTLDARANRAPVVVLLGGHQDGQIAAGHPLAEALMQAGFHVARVGYANAPGTPARVSRVPLEPLFAYIDGLAEAPNVDAKCIYLAGIEKGAELALLLGAGSASVGAVAALGPSHVVIEAPGFTPWPRSPWRRDGRDLAFVPLPRDLPALIARVRGQPMRALYAQALDRAGADTHAAIPIERIAGPVLLLGDPDDGLWPSDRMAQAAADRLASRGFAHPVDLRLIAGLANNPDVHRAVVTFLTAAAQRSGCLPAVAR